MSRETVLDVIPADQWHTYTATDRIEIMTTGKAFADNPADEFHDFAYFTAFAAYLAMQTGKTQFVNKCPCYRHKGAWTIGADPPIVEEHRGEVIFVFKPQSYAAIELPP
jgi:hypothetical protein